MKLLVLGVFLAAFVPGAVSADPAQPFIPPSFYPHGSRITFDASYSNQSMDAAWDFDASGEPLMHRYPQHVFLRQSGWMEQAFVQRGNRLAWFILFDSTYGTYADGQHGNLAAFNDLRLMLSKWWQAGLARQQPRNALPGGSSGAVETRIIPKLDDGPFIVTSAWWGDTQEIEAIAFSSPHLLGWTKLRNMLYAQLRFAIGVPQSPAAQAEVPASAGKPTK